MAPQAAPVAMPITTSTRAACTSGERGVTVRRAKRRLLDTLSKPLQLQWSLRQRYRR